MILPDHVLNALSGKTAFLNSAFIERESETAKQKQIKQLQSNYAVKIETAKHSALDAIESADYDFSAHTYDGGETIFQILE